ncbi:MAG: OmpH family outer membrane protein [Bacteroidales bacterium]|nr:OmpH family outer membrane protein [Bacteroidales bacterium]
MKRVNLIINIVLVIAVGVLFVLHFTGNGKSKPLQTEEKFVENDGTEKGEIAYINIDTLMNNMDMFFDVRNQLIDKQKSSEAELNSRSKDFEREATDFQEKVRKGLVTRSRAQEIEQELYREQQDLIGLKDKLSLELAEEEQVLNRQLIYYITDYLKEYNIDNNYQFIISNSLAGPLLYASNKQDITNDVVKGINEKYAEERKSQQKDKK